MRVWMAPDNGRFVAWGYRLLPDGRFEYVQRDIAPELVILPGGEIRAEVRVDDEPA
jgi:hypothetical protein